VFDRGVRIYEYKSMVNDNTTEILLPVSFILVFNEYSNDKFVTLHNIYSKIPPSSPTHFVTRVWRSRVVRLS
jgi:hypothetical protein